LKLKTSNGLIIVDILTILLILSIVFVPSTIARVILGLPFLLFFPGYTLVAALFYKKEGMDNIERMAISFGMSIAVTALIGFGLNYTSWGIRLEPVLYSIAIFVFVTSAIALIRIARIPQIKQFTSVFTLNLPGWGGNTLNKSLSIILVIAIFGTIGILGYTIAAPKIGERFTEFYILGIDGKAEDYPTEYIMNDGQITQVIYGDGTVDATSVFGTVALGVVNNDQQTIVYSVDMTINGKPANIEYNGTIVNELGPIELQQGQQWQQNIGITPQQIGDNQKVELLLYKGTETVAEDSLHFWINVKPGP
jgi:uncharacterized membrane protein